MEGVSGGGSARKHPVKAGDEGDDGESGEGDGKRRRTVKEPRMTTNKQKKGNYYADANVKNRRR